jgi:hypothetical protein
MLVHNIRSTIVLILVKCIPEVGNVNSSKVGMEIDAESRYSRLFGVKGG